MTFERFFVVIGSQFSMDSAVISGGALGAIVPREVNHAAFAGIVLFSLAILALYFGRRVIALRFPLSLIWWGLGSCVLVAAGRNDLGAYQAMSSRYYPVAVLVTIGLVIYFARIKYRGYSTAFLPVVLSGVLFFTIWRASDVEWKTGKYRLAFQQDWRNAVLNYQFATDEGLKNPHFTSAQIREFAKILDQWNLSLFRNRPDA